MTSREPEIWKSICGLEELYEISSWGNLRSLDRVITDKDGCKSKYKGKIRKNAINPNRYIVNSIRGKTYFIHVEVAKAFVPNPENKPEVNHLDGDKSNCYYKNLAWATRLENIEHAFKNKLIIPAIGEHQSSTKLTEEQVIDIFYNMKECGCRELGRMFGVGHKAIVAIRNGLTWNHITGLPRKTPLKHTPL